MLLNSYVRRLSAIGSGCAISCGPALSWFELDNRGRRLVAAGHGINTPAVAAAFATTPYTAHATDELSFQVKINGMLCFIANKAVLLFKIFCLF